MLEKLKYIKTLAEVRYSESEIRRPLGEQMPKRKAIKEKIVETVKNALRDCSADCELQAGIFIRSPRKLPHEVEKG